jgi:hypothetical protein
MRQAFPALGEVNQRFTTASGTGCHAFTAAISALGAQVARLEPARMQHRY